MRGHAGDGPMDSASLLEILMILKVLYVDRRSGVPRKDFVQGRMANGPLALETIFKMWFAQERSSLRERPRSLSD